MTRVREKSARWLDSGPRVTEQPMSSEALGGFQTVETTEDEPADDHRVLDLDATRALSIPGATLIECDAYERTQDGHALRFSGAVPLFVVGVYSRRDARHALRAAGYEATDIDRAFENGEWMSREHNDHATEAVTAAESGGLATDGGVVETTDPAARDSPVERGDFADIHVGAPCAGCGAYEQVAATVGGRMVCDDCARLAEQGVLVADGDGQ